jgi:hypothetical protein
LENGWERRILNLSCSCLLFEFLLPFIVSLYFGGCI